MALLSPLAPSRLVRTLTFALLIGTGLGLGLARTTGFLGDEPGAWTLLPIALTLISALVLRQVVFALLSGVLLCALGQEGLGWDAFARTLDTHLLHAVSDPEHASVILLTLFIAGLVALLVANGGMSALVDVLARWAKTTRSIQMVTWLSGLIIFFDDYANSLLVGNTMQPVFDRYKLSRAKLAYLVDSTAAPVAAIAVVTTWIGAELSYIEEATATLQMTETPQEVFLGSLQYAFYPVLTILFIGYISWRRKDYGPMLKVERAARAAPDPVIAEPEVDAPKRKPYLAWNALLPILVMLVVTLWGLAYTGQGAVIPEGAGWLTRVSLTLGNADAFSSLLWSSFSALVVAFAMGLARGTVKFDQGLAALTKGFQEILPAAIVLTLAWALSGVISDIRAADYLLQVLDGQIAPAWFPAVVFVFAAVVSFATGTSWGTMGIMYPLVLPLAYSLGLEAPELDIFLQSAAMVLAGAVFGDHCSPLADTTILSSLASGCDHIEHVKTQFPYALTTALISLFIAVVMVPFGLPFWVDFAVGIGLMVVVVEILGKRVETD